MKKWQLQLKSAVTNSSHLYCLLELEHLNGTEHTAFPVRVPLPFINRMKKCDPSDPLLLQVSVRPDEFEITEGYSKDPLKEATTNPIPGLLHKYHGRVLIVLTSGCAINCRYCFRRHFPYNDNSGLSHWTRILDYIKADDTISEVILSGGDPLLVDDQKFACIIQDLDAIKHLSTLRIHTRLPIVIPARITTEFLTLLSQTRLHVVTVLHCNHPNEIDLELQQQLKRLSAVSHMLNQAVLLKNINDSVVVLDALSRRLFECNVLPYYLHQLDQVAGAHHFFVPKEKGLTMLSELAARLPGYLVPRFVEEVAGERNKIMLT